MSLATTFTDIANLALKSIGAVSIESIDANSTHAKAINGVIDEVVRQVQIEIHWPELLNVQELVQLPGTFGDIGGAYQYQLPEDFLQVVEMTDDCPLWELIDNTLITPATSAKIIYKRYIEDVTKWSGELTECIYKKLAAEIAMAVTQDPTMFQIAGQKYETARSRVQPIIMNRSRKKRQTLRRFSYLQVRDYRGNRNNFGGKPFNPVNPSE